MTDSQPAGTKIRRAGLGDAAELARLRWEFSVELEHADEELADRLVGTVWVEHVDKVPRPFERPARWAT